MIVMRSCSGWKGNFNSVARDRSSGKDNACNGMDGLDAEDAEDAAKADANGTGTGGLVMFLYISCIFSWDMSIFSMFLWLVHRCTWKLKLDTNIKYKNRVLKY